MRLHDGHYLAVTKRHDGNWMAFSTLYGILLFGRLTERAAKRDIIAAVQNKIRVEQNKLDAYLSCLEEEKP
jgi:hypothetical protein